MTVEDFFELIIRNIGEYVGEHPQVQMKQFLDAEDRHFIFITLDLAEAQGITQQPSSWIDHFKSCVKLYDGVPPDLFCYDALRAAMNLLYELRLQFS